MKRYYLTAFVYTLLCCSMLLLNPQPVQAQGGQGMVVTGGSATQTSAGTNVTSAGHTINNGVTQTITGPGGACAVITNNTGRPIFVPTGNQTSWNTYVSRTISGVTIAGCTANCTAPWGGNVNHGASITAYQASNPAGACVSQTRTCFNGVLSGSYIAQTCNAGCTGTPWGNVSHSYTGTAYAASSVACGSSCASQTRTCTNGTMSGTYTHTSCSASACSNCTGTPWGTVNHGSSVTGYASSAPAGACSSETRSCNNGALSGTYTATSCNAGCTGTPWGNLTHGSTRTGYASATPAGACASQTRTCSNGSLSGTYTATSCTAGCTGTPWGNVAHGYSNTAYAASSVACGSSCTAQTRTCSSGAMSGSYTATSCSVAACPAPVCGPYLSCTTGTVSNDNGATSCGVNRTWTCTSGGSSVNCSAYNGSCGGGFGGGGGGGGCFLSHVKITMADGTQKLITDVKVGDKVKGLTRVNTVQRLTKYIHKPPVYGVNGKEAFVTAEHPFFGKDGKLYAIDPELTYAETKGELNPEQLKPGVVISTLDGDVTIETISLTPMEPRPVYNLVLDGDHSYYADGFAVHNFGMEKQEKF